MRYRIQLEGSGCDHPDSHALDDILDSEVHFVDADDDEQAWKEARRLRHIAENEKGDMQWSIFEVKEIKE